MNWTDNDDVVTDFTATKLATSMFFGFDEIEGSRDDTPTPHPGSRVLHWFRLSDNNPITIDSMPIDSSTYSRSLFAFPAGSTWSASANSEVAAALGAPSTQTPMVGTSTENSHYIYLTADDVNTVKYGMAGLDTDPGDVSDDYTVELVFEPTCALADVEVNFQPFPPNQTNVSGLCVARLVAIPSEGNLHFRVAPALTEVRLTVTVSSNFVRPPFPPYPAVSVVWQFLVFIDGFETGTTSEWDLVNP